MAARARWWGPALVFVLALGALGGCGDDDDGGGGSADEATTTSAAQGPGNPVTPAATFRTDLTALLHEHVYLVGLAAAGAGDVGGALDDNTQDITDKIASAFGTTVGTQFSELWGEHADQLVAGATPTSFPGEMEEFLAEHLGEEPAARVAAELEAHVDTAAAAVAALTGGGGGGAALRSAASSMTEVGTTLSLILVEDLALEGDAEAPAAELRVTLTDLLFEHVYLVALAAGDAPGAADATAALDANTAALADVIGEVYDADAAAEFTDVWGAHADLLAAFAAEGGSPDQLRAGLDRFRGDLGGLLEEVSGEELAAEAVAEEMIPHVDTIIPAIQALQDGSGGGAELREAAAVMSSTAETFATAFSSALE